MRDVPLPPRPRGVTFLALVYFGIAALMLLAALTVPADLKLTRSAAENPQRSQAAVRGALLIVAAIAALLGSGLWRLRKWARTLVTLSALGALFPTTLMMIVWLARLDPRQAGINFLGIVVNAWIAYYLMRPRVREAFIARATQEKKVNIGSGCAQVSRR